MAYARVAVEEGIKVIETAGDPSKILKFVKDSGCTVIHKCVTLKHALRAEKLGVDCISIDGIECAGHGGEYVSLVPNLYRVRQSMVACIPKSCLGFVRHLVFPIQVLSTDNKPGHDESDATYLVRGATQDSVPGIWRVCQWETACSSTGVRCLGDQHGYPMDGNERVPDTRERQAGDCQSV